MDAATTITNAGMVAFDVALGAGALAAPDRTLRLLGHTAPSPDARRLFQRCGPIWLTFAAAHAVAAVRGEQRDWWALSWLRATEIATDAVWAGSPAIPNPLSRAALFGAGAANLAFTLAFARRSRQVA
ncbi:hypothetical protein [Conexibacter sp. SYSU D00693]|uniref:hypothetical protein n=1 Tax=Conexibacter sp. SYSU D00693 TaxID=2812560 RepID=UPI00196AC7F1|nr:hypothetical protein [Conexibacter sp. SYSU D00693]